MAKRNTVYDRPTAEQLEAELSRINGGEKTKSKWLAKIGSFLAFFGVILIILFCLFPVASADGHIYITTKLITPEAGDEVVISYGNHKICRRIAAMPGDTVDIDMEGKIFVNGDPLEQKYAEMDRDDGVDMDFPCGVNDEEFFVITDDINKIPDSRNSKLGCVEERIVFGKIIFTVK